MNIGTIGSLVIILIIVIYFGIKYYKKFKTDEGAEDLHRFFNSIREAAEDAMIKYISHIDISNITNINDMQRQVLSDLYDIIWNLCIHKLSEEADQDMAKIINTLLTRETVESFIQEVYESSIEVQEKVTSKYNDAVLSAANNN